jgi:hypothetical protein
LNTLTPWYKIATPREDLRKGTPVDAAEFAVHLDQVVDDIAPIDYRDGSRLFSRTYLTEGLSSLIAEVERRLSGQNIGSSAVIILTTQFGGGKTHALTLLYHLAKAGSAARKFEGVQSILREAKIPNIPKAAVAVFVGNAFDTLKGKQKEGEPVRKTPWGDIAWQLGTFQEVEEHDSKGIAPGKDVIRKILPKDKPTLILMDEVLNFMSRERNSSGDRPGAASQFYAFLQNLTEEAGSRPGVCVVLSLPKSEQREMTVEDQEDFARLQKLVQRVGKPYVLSEGLEIAEIIRRRLFEDMDDDDRKERRKVAKAYSEWMVRNRDKLPTWFPVDNAEQVFEATYPFHPIALSVFERKWAGLQQFQKTRGVLRMLAMWVSRVYKMDYTAANQVPLIELGSAPLEDKLFRALVFDQLGQDLETAVTSDIAGPESHAKRLDDEATETIKRDRLHRKVAASILFESSGGQIKQFATAPEIRLAVSNLTLDIGNVETVLEDLSNECYYVTGEGRKYWVSPSPNLNKLLADRKANVSLDKVEEEIKEQIIDVFSQGAGVDKIYFPNDSAKIPDRPALTLLVLDPQYSLGNGNSEITNSLVEKMTKEHGESGRTFKSALIWVVADSQNSLVDDARRLLAWRAIQSEGKALKLNESQEDYLRAQLNRAARDLKESVWRAYKNVLVLGKDGSWKNVDLGLVHSSAAPSLLKLILNKLEQEGDLVQEAVNPNFLVRNWPPALREWSTKSVRDAFFASPQFSRLYNPESIKKTIAEGVSRGLFGYAERVPGGNFDNVRFDSKMFESDIELSDQVFLLPKDVARTLKDGGSIEIKPPELQDNSSRAIEVAERQENKVPPTEERISRRIGWEGSVPAQKWMTFYTKVLSRFPLSEELKLEVKFEAAPKEGISKLKVQEVRAALKDLGLSDEVNVNEENS